MEQEEAGLLWLIPLSETLPGSLSSLLLVRRSLRRSHRAVLGRAAFCAPGAPQSALDMPHKSAMTYLGSPGITGQKHLLQAVSMLDRGFAALGDHDQTETWWKSAGLLW